VSTAKRAVPAVTPAAVASAEQVATPVLRAVTVPSPEPTATAAMAVSAATPVPVEMAASGSPERMAPRLARPEPMAAMAAMAAPAAPVAPVDLVVRRAPVEPVA
jgi:hypothetical protein